MQWLRNLKEDVVKKKNNKHFSLSCAYLYLKHMGALDDFSYINGNNRLREIETKLDSISTYLSQSFYAEPMQYVLLQRQDPIPTGVYPTGALAVSGSATTFKGIHVWTGAKWTGSWASYYAG